MDPSCRPARHFFMFSDAYTVNLGLEARPAGGRGGEGGGVLGLIAGYVPLV